MLLYMLAKNWWQVVKQSHAFKLLVDVTFKVEVSGGEAQPGNLPALDVLIQSVIISKMMNLSSESFRMENHVQMQTDPCSATTTMASVGCCQCLLLKVLHVTVDGGQNWWQVVNHSQTFSLFIDPTSKVEVSGGETQPGNLLVLFWMLFIYGSLSPSSLSLFSKCDHDYPLCFHSVVGLLRVICLTRIKNCVYDELFFVHWNK